MATRILDTDIMILQKLGNHDVLEPHMPNGGPYPNLKYDLETFHFLGEDLRYTVEQYVEDSHQFVRIDGDVMSGNLEIQFPQDGEVEQSEPAKLKLQGYQKGDKPYSAIDFTNRASGSNFTMTISAVHPVVNSSTQRNFFKIGDRCSITDSGRMYLDGRYICANGNGGLLAHVDETLWDPSKDIIIKDIPPTATRLRWTEYGGALKNSLGYDVLQWSQSGVKIKQFDGNFVIASSHETSIEYFGDVLEPFHMVHKQYVDSQDWKYIPLEGTEANTNLERDAVYGPINFVDGGYLNAKMGDTLKLEYNNIPFMGIGGDPTSGAGTADGQYIHITAPVDVHSNVIKDVKYPDEPYIPGGGTVEDSHAVPRKYVDDGRKILQDQFDSGADLTAPPGMINAYVGTTAPDGWFLCDGSSYNPAEMPKLHDALGQPADAKVPDLKGRYLAQIGSGTGIGTTIRAFVNQSTAKPKNWTISATNANSGNHTHTVQSVGNHTHGQGNMTATTKGQKEAQSTNKGRGYELVDVNENARGERDIYLNVHGNTNSAGGHSHVVNSDGTHQHSITLTTGWDNDTKPDTYSINWIIKHDNGVIP